MEARRGQQVLQFGETLCWQINRTFQTQENVAAIRHLNVEKCHKQISRDLRFAALLHLRRLIESSVFAKPFFGNLDDIRKARREWPINTLCPHEIDFVDVCRDERAYRVAPRDDDSPLAEEIDGMDTTKDFFGDLWVVLNECSGGAVDQVNADFQRRSRLCIFIGGCS